MVGTGRRHRGAGPGGRDPGKWPGADGGRPVGHRAAAPGRTLLSPGSDDAPAGHSGAPGPGTHRRGRLQPGPCNPVPADRSAGPTATFPGASAAVHRADRRRPRPGRSVVIMTRPDLTPQQASRLSVAEQHEWFRSVTRRRRVRLTGGGAGPRATPMLLARAGRPDGARVPPFGRHVAFGADPARQMSVAWQVPAPVAGPFLRLGESPRDL